VGSDKAEQTDMDILKYRELFISESSEILISLNKFLVKLEKDPDDRDCLNEVFRQVHTLKGMAGSMGYAPIETRAHAMEEKLDSMRANKLKVTKAAVSALFEDLDSITKLLEKAVEAEGQAGDGKRVEASSKEPANSSQTQPEEDASSWVEKRTNLRLEEQDRAQILTAMQAGQPTYRVTISLNKDCTLRLPRALVIVKLLNKAGVVIRSEHVLKQLRAEKFGRHFGLFLTTGGSPDVITKGVCAVPDVEQITFKPLERDEVETPQPDSTPKPREKKSVKRDAQTVRVSLSQLDLLMNIVGELSINKSRVERIAQSLGDAELDQALGHTVQITNTLQEHVMELRLLPLDYIFDRYPRMIRNLASEQKKEVDFIIEGGDVGLDRSILDEIHEPLVHLLKNAVTHGIEPAADRKAAGKSETGQIRLSARRERQHVLIEVFDDGAGINPEEIRTLAVEKGIISPEEASKLDDDDALMLTTVAGFSTAREISHAAGRGVGMDSVRAKTESLGGNLSIQSTPGKGSHFSLRLPLTLAIVKALLVGVGTEVFAIPLINILETVKVERAAIKKLEDHEIIAYRDAILPLVSLADWYGFERQKQDHSRAQAEEVQADDSRLTLVVIESGTKKIGFIIDRLIGQQEVVIKMLTESLKQVRGIAGATILGDGKVALIADVYSVL